MNREQLPNWIVNLEAEDLSFIKRFVFHSGSLKDLAAEYDISYPTLRIRLDRLIEKVKLFDTDETDVFIERIRALAIDAKIDVETAKQLIAEYKKVKK
ncbi:MAG: DUF2089 family protein [Bacilli bacterium]|jgi:hypothetical protein